MLGKAFERFIKKAPVAVMVQGVLERVLNPDALNALYERGAAAVQWYAQGIVFQGRAAELAGLARTEFLDELYRRKVPACQVGDIPCKTVFSVSIWVLQAAERWPSIAKNA